MPGGWLFDLLLTSRGKKEEGKKTGWPFGLCCRMAWGGEGRFCAVLPGGNTHISTGVRCVGLG